MGKRLILGIGNLLLRDEGVGVHVAKILEEMSLPEGVEVVEGGTLGFDLLGYFEGVEKLVVVDALKGGGEPGSIYKVKPEQLKASKDRPLSLHQLGFLEVWEMARLLGFEPEVVIIGVEPKDLGWGMELSPEVESKLQKVVEVVLEEVRDA